MVFRKDTWAAHFSRGTAFRSHKSFTHENVLMNTKSRQDGYMQLQYLFDLIAVVVGVEIGAFEVVHGVFSSSESATMDDENDATPFSR